LILRQRSARKKEAASPPKRACHLEAVSFLLIAVR
jgi:hypothetical protein